MSFDRVYDKRKDIRRRYYDSRNFDRGCRNHKACSYCRDSRTRFDVKARQIADEKLEEVFSKIKG